MLRHLALLLLLCTCAPALLAQNPAVSFEAELSKNKMLVNSTVEYVVTLRNARGSDLQPPDFGDFEVLRGPMRSIGTSSINGVGSSYQSFSWQLQPKRAGTFTLRPATVRVGSRTRRSNSQTVEVLPVDATAAASQPDNFVRMEVSTTSGFVGQQFVLDLNLYYTGNIISRNIVREPDFDGFFAQPRRQYDSRPRPVIENGKEYQRRTLGSIALFPNKSGRLVIPPYRMVLGALRFRQGNSFSRRYTEQIPLSTDTLFLDVRELPQPRPDDFSGGVGRYTMATTVDRNTMTTDDALTLRLTITGEGDIKRFDNFPPVDEDDWSIFDPKVLEEDFLDSPTGMLGRKTLEYKIVPRRAGRYDLRPTLSYFNVDSAAFVSVTPNRFAVEVTAGSGAISYEIDTTSTPEEVLSLRPAGAVPAGRDYGSGLPGSPVYWGLFILPLLLAGGAIGYERYREQRANRDPAEVARERAARAATQRLREAKAHLDRVEARPFYDAIEGALFGYLRDKLQLPVAQLSRSSAREQLTAAGADAALADRYDALLQRCEMALYAGQDKADDLAATYADASTLIQDTERAIA